MRRWWNIAVNILFLSIMLLLAPVVTFAHQTGASYNKVVGPYLIDIGYNPAFLELQTREAFDFRLWQAASMSKMVPFDDVFVQIKQGDTVLLSTTSRKQDIFYPTLIYTPTVAGQLSMYVRYELGGKEVTEVTMPLTVIDPNDLSGLLKVTITTVGIFLLGYALYRAFKRYWPAKQP